MQTSEFLHCKPYALIHLLGCISTTFKSPYLGQDLFPIISYYI